MKNSIIYKIFFFYIIYTFTGCKTPIYRDDKATPDFGTRAIEWNLKKKHKRKKNSNIYLS